MPGHDIIVIGASAGGVEALTKLVSTLPADLPAAVFVVLHIPAQSPSLLPNILSRSGTLKAIGPEDGDAIQYGTIYVAPPDQHLLIERNRVRVVRGPKENRHRPAIDPLFRSAALAHGPRAVGVILTGSLDDGTAGLLAIKQCSGIAIVQDPDEALYPSMPLSALAHVKVDYTLPISEIGSLLTRLANEQVPEEGSYPMSEDMEREIKLAEMDTDLETISSNGRNGTPSVYSCPDCGGVLWEVHDGELLRFRCRVGHAFSVESVLAAQSEQLEEALWTALKTLEENASLSRRMAKQARARGQEWLARNFDEKLHQAEEHALTIQQVLQKDKLILPNEAESKQGE